MERTEWLAERLTGIGGSEAASVFNVGWGCRRRLAYEKRGIEADWPFDETLLMELGSLLEPWLANQYALATGRTLSAPSSFSHPEHPELRVNVDRIISPVPEHDGPGVLEIKAQGQAVFSKTKREGLSENYILQLQWGMLVTGCKWGSFAIGCRDSGALTHWDVDRNDDICDSMLIEGPKLWSQIKDPAAPLPERLEIDDHRCSSCSWRAKCQGDALIHVSGESDLADAEDIRPLVAEHDVRTALVKEAEALLEDTREALKTALADRPAARLAWDKGERHVFYRGQDGKVSWRMKDLVMQYKLMQKEHPEVPDIDTFKRQGVPFRVLRVY